MLLCQWSMSAVWEYRQDSLAELAHTPEPVSASERAHRKGNMNSIKELEATYEEWLKTKAHKANGYRECRMCGGKERAGCSRNNYSVLFPMEHAMAAPPVLHVQMYSKPYGDICIQCAISL